MKFSHDGIGRIIGLSAPIAVAMLTVGCSSDVSRFDFPTLGLSDGEATSSIPTPSEPVYNYTPPPRQTPNYGSGRRWGARKGSDIEPDLASRTSPASRTNAASRALPPLARRGNINDGPRSGLGRLGRKEIRRKEIRSSRLPDETRTGRTVTRRPARIPAAPLGGKTSPDLASTSTSTRTIEVRRGDTLYQISHRYGVPVSAILAANALPNATIRAGQKLIVPTDGIVPEQTYRVRSGESLFAIAKRFSIRPETLARSNGIDDPTRLRAGSKLRIPSRRISTGRTRTGTGSGSPASGATRQALGGSDTGVRSVRTRDMRPTARTRRPLRVTALKSRPGTSRIDVPPVAAPWLSSAQKQRRKQRVARLPAPAPRASTKFRWPVRGRIISGFGKKNDGSFNDGIDLAVPIGTSVKAAENGVVAYVGSALLERYGKLILIRHADGWVSAYANNDKLLVKRGDRVRRGQIIAKAGKTGSVDRPQLHFELRAGARPVDPLQHLPHG